MASSLLYFTTSFLFRFVAALIELETPWPLKGAVKQEGNPIQLMQPLSWGGP